MKSASLRRALVLAVLALLVAACGEPLTRGEVVGKRYEPPRDYTEMVAVPHTECHPVPYGTSGGTRQDCTTHFTYIPQQRHDDADWVLLLKDCKQEDGGCRRGEIAVSERVFERTKEGDYFDAAE